MFNVRTYKAVIKFILFRICTVTYCHSVIVTRIDIYVVEI